MMRIFQCLDLRDNTIDVQAIGQIAMDVSNLHIHNLKFNIGKYYMVIEPIGLRKMPTKSNVEITFSRKHESESRHTTTMHAKVRFFANRKYYVVHMELSAIADYEYMPYENKIQDYLYTYFAHIIENDTRVQTHNLFALPDNLSVYYPGSEWDLFERRTYHWIDIDDYTSIKKISPLDRMPHSILKIFMDK